MSSPRPRGRCVGPLVALAVVAAALAAVAAWNPFHLVWSGRCATVLVAAALVLSVAAATLRLQTTGARAAVVVAGVLVVAAWSAAAWVSAALTPELVVISEVAGPPGSRIRLALVEVQTLAVDGRTFSVRARAGTGALAQESVVWTVRSAEIPRPQPRFVDARHVEIIDAAGCTLRSDVDPVTLGVDPVDAPERSTGCG
ncbi:hypothetical protein PSU4_57440 [Pseudonocardia sulfidoxydans NBRC 16205]|uniref:Uncharacterized protein n=1 Tax=Pseudonocardia sulfidoxydans NBRC 16205 TaxID=1223511 RepID=A0A511DPP3_9PSEU|nr:hypothetical protein [Pseudonocardia sulfidoxydans]GEL26790.1 hypothetical protein PSU4_57440 [Pseudonocardia sulfidoxydans NBRC 16205]